MPDNLMPEAAEPFVLPCAAAAEVASVRPAPQVLLCHLAGCDGRRPKFVLETKVKVNVDKTMTINS